MSDIKITADLKQVERLGEQFTEAALVGLRRVVERGEQILRDEVPKVTHNLEQGVSSDVEVKPNLLEGILTVSARSGRKGRRPATLHKANGKTKKITLRAQPAFDYALAVAEGTGVYIAPKNAKALLVPVDSPPAPINGKPQAYVEADGQIYVMRRSVKGRKANPYDQRAARRLESEAPGIFDKALELFA